MKEEELIGEKIKSAKIVCHQKKGCDGKNLLVLKMDSGKTFYIEGGYGGYTGDSCDEYYEKIEVKTEHNFSGRWLFIRDHINNMDEKTCDFCAENMKKDSNHSDECACVCHYKPNRT